MGICGFVGFFYLVSEMTQRMKGLMWKNLTTLLVSVRYEKAHCSVVDAINNGRTNPGYKQSSEG